MTAEQEIERLTTNLERSSVRISEAVIVEILSGMRETLTGPDLQARQHVLQTFVQKIEVEREIARLHCMIKPGVLWFVPPTGFEPVSQP